MVGDMGEVRWQSCACGRNGLALATFEGRVNDRIRLASGRYLSSIFFPQVVRQFPGIRQAQLARLSLNHFTARFTGEMSPGDKQRMAELVGRICEGARVDVVRLESIERTPQGKLLYYVDESSAQT